MTEKKNEIWIGKNGRGYFLDCTDKHYKYNGKTEEYSKQYLIGEDFFSLAQEIIIMPDYFYEKGIKLKFEKNPVTKIPKREKSI